MRAICRTPSSTRTSSRASSRAAFRHVELVGDATHLRERAVDVRADPSRRGPPGVLRGREAPPPETRASRATRAERDRAGARRARARRRARRCARISARSVARSCSRASQERRPRASGRAGGGEDDPGGIAPAEATPARSRDGPGETPPSRASARACGSMARARPTRSPGGLNDAPQLSTGRRERERACPIVERVLLPNARAFSVSKQSEF